MSNLSTTVIDRPGLYLTRNNKQVRIDCIREYPAGGSFPCTGFVLRVDTLGRTYRKYNTWKKNGCHKATVGSSLDIVAYVSA